MLERSQADESIEDCDYLDNYSFVIQENIKENLKMVSVECEDYHNKHYADEGLAKIIQQLIAPGYYTILAFDGEDGSRWGYFIAADMICDISYQVLVRVDSVVGRITLPDMEKKFGLIDSYQARSKSDEKTNS